MARGGRGRPQRLIGHAVAAAEQNFVWRVTNDIFRPVKSEAFDAAEAAAKNQGKKLPDPRAGHPTHRKGTRLTRPQQLQVAAELGYKPYRGGGNPKEPIFENPDGKPPFISYDHTAHGAADRSGNLEPNIPWKGAANVRTLNNRGRDATYVPKYDADGNVVFDPVRK